MWKKWKYALALAGIGIIIILARIFYHILANHKSKKDVEIFRLTIDHMEAERAKIKANIKRSETRRRALLDKYSKPIRGFILVLLLPAMLYGLYPVMLEPGDWRDFETATNAVEYFLQERQEFIYQIGQYQEAEQWLTNEIRLQKEMNKIGRPSTLENFINRWLPPLCLGLGMWIGASLQK